MLDNHNANSGNNTSTIIARTIHKKNGIVFLTVIPIGSPEMVLRT
jgi:hypothetical protein